MHDHDGLRYVVPGNGAAPVPLAAAASACSTSSRCRSRGAITGLVVRTPPGAAAALAEGIDRVGPAGGRRHDRRRQHDPHPRPGGRRRRGARTVAQPHHGGGRMKRAVLAYSGGLDTSVTIRWLVEQGYEVHAVAVDVGQQEDFDGVVERGRLAGAADVRVVDAVDRFAADYLVHAIKANALYEGKYPMVSGLARPLHRGGGRARSRARSAPTSWRTAAPARATTRSGSRCRSACSPPTCEVLAPIRDANIPREKALVLAEEWGIPLGVDRQLVLRRREPVGPHRRVRAARGPVGGAAGGRVREDGVAGGPSVGARRDRRRVRARAARGARRRRGRSCRP